VLGVTPITDIAGSEDPEAGSALDGRQVAVAGIISSVSVKITRKDERMAFITLEDRYGEIECILFPKVFRQYYELIRPDCGVYISGRVQLRENEPARIIAEEVGELVENSRYTGGAGRKKAQNDNKVPKGAAPGEDQPKSAGIGVGKKAGRRLFLRVEAGSEKFNKAVNLVEIFTGEVPVIFYDTKTASYKKYERGVALTDFVAGEFVELLGAENVVVK
jgi:DNA polymerase-3 subunit alpha